MYNNKSVLCEITGKMNLIKKNFCSAKGSVKKMKRQTADYEKIICE